MRILQVVHQYIPEYIGGTELHTHWLAEGLSRKGHQVGVFYRSPDAKIGLTHRVDDYDVQVWGASTGEVTPTKRFLATFSDAALLKQFQQIILEMKPEIIHIQHLMGLPVSLVNYIRQRKIPYVVTLHDYWWLCANAQLITNFDQTICDGPELYANCARCVLARAEKGTLWAAPPLMALLARRNQLLRNVLTNAVSIIAPSKFVADWYISHNIADKQITVLPHGLPLPLTFPERRDDRRQGVRFVYIGGLSWQKGVHVLLEAFQGVDNDAELWIAGDETADLDYAARLRQLASPGVRFLGKLNRDEVWQTLARVDAVVVPSLWYETFSFIVSEAFAMGIPVIASDIGALAERVQHGVDGLLVPPGDAVAWRRAMRQFGETSGELQKSKHSIKDIRKYIVDIEAIYQTIL